MSMTKLLHVVGKLVLFSMTAGFSVAHTIKAKRTQRGGSWIKRTRYAGVFEHLRTIIKRLVIAAFILLAVLIVITSF